MCSSDLLTGSLQEYDLVKRIELTTEKKKNVLLEKASDMTEKLLSEAETRTTVADQQ